MKECYGSYEYVKEYKIKDVDFKDVNRLFNEDYNWNDLFKDENNRVWRELDFN